MNKKECKIVQDLLPNYIENLTNNETKEFIINHLNNCTECNEIYNNINNDFYKKETEEKTNINFLKKHKKQMQILKFILLIILMIFVVIIARRIIILTQLYNKATKVQVLDNYYAKSYYYQENSIIVTESYYKNGNYLTTMTKYSQGNEEQTLVFYKNNNEIINLLQIGDEKYLLDNNSVFNITPTSFVTNDFVSNLQFAFIIGIDSELCNGKQCYVIKGKSFDRYIDKETGLVVRCISKNSINNCNDTIEDYEFKFNIVTDSSIKKPDVSDAAIFDKESN